jgi:type VI secretion system secreted protein Hcp
MSYRISKAIASLIALMVALSAGAQPATGERISVTIHGAKQGVFKGDRSGKISATAFTLESKSPADGASGRASGKVQNLPVTITKDVDAASPQIFQALCTNESLKSVTIEAYMIGPDGKEAVVQTVRLTSAVVTGLRQYVDAGGNTPSPGPREEVSFTYQSIEFGPPAIAAQAPAETKPAEPAPTEAKPAPARREPVLREPLEKPSPTRVPRSR